MLEVELMIQIRKLNVSATKILDLASSSAIPVGPDSVAKLASPPSPENPLAPFPATVDKVGVTLEGSKLQTLLFPTSAKNITPVLEETIESRLENWALATGVPSGLIPLTPLPATMEMFPVVTLSL